MEPRDSTKNLLTSTQCLNHRKSLPRRSVEKVNKCIQVDVDLEVENPSIDLTLFPKISLSKKPQQCPGNTSPPQQGVSSPSQGQPAMPALLPLLPPPPFLPTRCKIPPPPLLIPGINAPSLPPPQLCSNPECSHFTCGYSEQPCPKKTPKLRMKVFHWQKLPSDVVRRTCLFVTTRLMLMLGARLWLSTSGHTSAPIAQPLSYRKKKKPVITDRESQILH